MAWLQQEIQLAPRRRGCHLVTREVVEAVPELARFRLGLLHVFIRHTSASLSINENADPDVKDFVTHNFYVDDGLISLPNTSDAISLMKRTQSTMKCEGHIRLHKIVSNKQAVMEAFDISDRGEELNEIDIDHFFSLMINCHPIRLIPDRSLV